MDRFVNLPYLPSGSGKWFFFGALTIVFCVDFVDGRDVGCYKIWTAWRHAVSLMSTSAKCILVTGSLHECVRGGGVET